IDADHQINNLVRADLAEPVRRIWRNDDHIPRDDSSARAAQNRAPAGARTVQDLHHLAIGGRFARILYCAAGYEGRLAGDNVVDLGDLAVLDAVRRLLALRFRSVHHADADVVLVVDADDANLLIADCGRRRLLDRRHNFFVGDVGRFAAGLMLLSP